MLKLLIGKRTLIQIAFGFLVFILVYRYQLSLWYLLLAGAITGLVFGKVFCRWMCPMGVVMEFMMGLNPDQKFRQMYQYHKLGCPIAWIQGALNRFSLLGIKVNNSTCKNCGICDKECYITALEPATYSLYKPGKDNPAGTFACSKCLKCVEACPNGSLQFNLSQSKKK